MKVAVLSGKGGTGKTLLSVNLAAVVNHSLYIDCDVEEPNGHLFFKPKNVIQEHVSVKVPQWNADVCNGCRICTDFCNYNAMAFIKEKVVIFENICHSCGGCSVLCPQNALTEKNKIIGHIQTGESENVQILSGFLDPGIPSGVPIIKRLLDISKETNAEHTVIDCPPGSSCLVMESIKEADYCLLVAEPTIFGTQNLSMVHELVTLFNKPSGIILNKCGTGENPSEIFANQKNIKILASIPFDPILGQANAEGSIVSKVMPEYKELFTSICKRIEREVHHDQTIITT